MNTTSITVKLTRIEKDNLEAFCKKNSCTQSGIIKDCLWNMEKIAMLGMLRDVRVEK